MDYNLLSLIESVIAETDWHAENKAFIANSIEDGNRSEQLVSNMAKNELQFEEDEEAEDIEDTEDAEEESEEVGTPDESPSTIDLSDASKFRKLISNLNQFRASHSLSDEEVNDELEKYFDRLTADEKKILHVFIKGLTQVTLLDVSGKTAYVPSDLNFKVTKGGAVSSEKLKSKKRLQQLTKDTPDTEVSDATNTPIRIGDSIQEKYDILKVIKENA